MSNEATLSAIKKFTSKYEEILFYTDGEIFTTKEKYVPCTAVVSTSIIYVFKYHFGGKMNLKQRVSIHDLKEIRYLTSLARLFVTEDTSFNIQLEKIQEFETSIMVAMNKFNYSSNCPLIIQFTGYPDEPPKAPQLQQRPENLILSRYHTLITRFTGQSHLALKNTYLFFESTYRTSITFDDKISDPEYTEYISVPIAHESLLRYLNFNNFATNGINFILRDIIYGTKSITTITLRNYASKLNPTVIEFSKSSNPSIIAWTFENCFENANDFLEFFESFSQYQGTIQCLTIRNVSLTTGVIRAFGNLLKSSRCFVDMESLILDNISCGASNGLEIFNTIDQAAKFLTKLTNFSCSGWESTIVQPRITLGSPYEITACQGLRHIALTHSSFAESEGFLQFPPNLCEIDVSYCVFSSASLIAFIRSIKEFGKNLTVNLTAIQMKTTEWQAFYRDCSTLIGINNIIELNYSSNQFPQDFEKVFCQIFVTPTLKFINLSDIFTPESISKLFYIIDQLAQIDLYGITIDGTDQHRLGDSLVDLVLNLRKIKSLEFLAISNHLVSDQATVNLYKHLPALKMIHELTVDGTENLGRVNFFGFYKRIWMPKNILSIGFPIIDYKRLFSKKEAIVQEFGSERCQAWWEVMFSKQNVSNSFIRSEFYRRNLKFVEFAKFLVSFPIPLRFPRADNHFFHFNWPESAMNQKSLFDEEFLETDSFVTRQIASMTTVFQPPKFEGPSEITIPLILRRYFGTEQFNVKRNIVEIKEDHSELIREDFIKSHYDMINVNMASLLIDVDRICDMLEQLAEEETDLTCKVEDEKPPEIINQAELNFFRNELRALQKDTMYDDSLQTRTRRGTFVISHNQMETQSKKMVSIKNVTRREMKKSMSIALNEDYVALLNQIQKDGVIVKDLEQMTLARLRNIAYYDNKIDKQQDESLTMPRPYPVSDFTLDESIQAAVDGKRVPDSENDKFSMTLDEVQTENKFAEDDLEIQAKAFSVEAKSKNIFFQRKGSFILPPMNPMEDSNLMSSPLIMPTIDGQSPNGSVSTFELPESPPESPEKEQRSPIFIIKPTIPSSTPVQTNFPENQPVLPPPIPISTKIPNNQSPNPPQIRPPPVISFAPPNIPPIIRPKVANSESDDNSEDFSMPPIGQNTPPLVTPPHINIPVINPISIPPPKIPEQKPISSQSSEDEGDFSMPQIVSSPTKIVIPPPPPPSNPENPNSINAFDRPDFVLPPNLSSSFNVSDQGYQQPSPPVIKPNQVPTKVVDSLAPTVPHSSQPVKPIFIPPNISPPQYQNNSGQNSPKPPTITPPPVITPPIVPQNQPLDSLMPGPALKTPVIIPQSKSPPPVISPPSPTKPLDSLMPGVVIPPKLPVIVPPPPQKQPDDESPYELPPSLASNLDIKDKYVPNIQNLNLPPPEPVAPVIIPRKMESTEYSSSYYSDYSDSGPIEMPNLPPPLKESLSKDSIPIPPPTEEPPAVISPPNEEKELTTEIPLPPPIEELPQSKSGEYYSSYYSETTQEDEGNNEDLYESKLSFLPGVSQPLIEEVENPKPKKEEKKISPPNPRLFDSLMPQTPPHIDQKPFQRPVSVSPTPPTIVSPPSISPPVIVPPTIPTVGVRPVVVPPSIAKPNIPQPFVPPVINKPNIPSPSVPQLNSERFSVPTIPKKD
ncbi:hypothetical protein TVAG_324490 [Trichomonas vaginalis G3]|uniref:Leucine Rich Repeat family protein n=1 Tax=Trichomonas vaginalis (strain ATCC PRA-98 / G3) TaxID=412133 RepID=A2FFQ0_TRIV3|nr:ribonuclease inhibitor domain-containing protein [Trichomonas vaginalis G3]EAX96275.1 hypothetical protein TVAG_324490 [Trichomonas vaginalis G3]KAI5516278.1 ribonuclease inhibitor domain-containing protein [Trichomonas vaginalis G3]|eukprot:XP_001309205.1 hypothetical protein [Trichomonas vaginalis G3]